MKQFVIIIDTREQKPFEFHATAKTIPGTLKAGDYSIAGMESRIAIERKSMIDLFGTCGKGRERFERELMKLASYEFAAIVIEGTWHDIARRPPMHTGMPPKSVIASLIAWQQRYGIQIVAAGPKPLAARITYLMLERFWRDVQDGKRQVTGTHER